MSLQVRFHCRHDLDDLFRLSGILTATSLNHHPFLAIMAGEGTEGEPSVVILPFKSAYALAQSALADDTFCMVQWPGKWRSDWFKMTVGTVREALATQKTDTTEKADPRW